jgi:pimeloyl-ACP methyl ester carboxylesterase
MLARLQRCITLSLMAAATGWFLLFFRSAPMLAVAGSLAIVLGYAGFLALEFAALRWVNRGDPAPQPTIVELLHAWIGETLTAPRVFCWRQPFRQNAVPDRLLGQGAESGRRGVVFVHGFFCNRGFWTPWLRRREMVGRAFVAVNLEPIFGSIDDYAPQIEAAVRVVTEATGGPPLLVCHSMGGLAARAWLKNMNAEHRVHRVVTIGTPHGGTWLARFGRGVNGQQMRLKSQWSAGLDHGSADDRQSLQGRFTCWYSNCDNIVFPVSTATLPHADNRLVRGAAHVQLAFVPCVMRGTLSMLD